MKAVADIRDEEILLLGLCRLEFGPELKIMLRALAENLADWDYFAAMANLHGVASLAHHNLEKLGFYPFIPAKTKVFLQNAAVRSLVSNTAIMKMMEEVLEIIGKNKIKTVLLKGVALESTIYGNTGVRQMSDADILIAGDACVAAYNELRKHGFVPLPVKSFFHSLILPYAGKHLPSLLKYGCSVEIHRDLFGAGMEELTGLLYGTSIKTELSGREAFIPEDRIFFLYLLRHLHYHEMNNESQLRLYADLAVLLEKKRDRILSAELLVLANRAGLTRVLAAKLAVLRDLWGTGFPQWINEFIDKWYSAGEINRFVFFLKSPKNNPPETKKGYYRLTVRAIPGFHRKILFVMGDLFPTFSFMKKRYGCNSAWKTLLFYPHRFGKLLWLLKG